ncbi:hypothetical protein J4404_03140 [Candidatus Woesearchaeota archaeon]|nr:hypothetical protein [Candidatus Woesearchaeota archaeon]
MNKTTTIVIIILALAVLFLAYTVMSSSGGVPVSSYPTGQYAGGGCGI